MVIKFSSGNGAKPATRMKAPLPLREQSRQAKPITYTFLCPKCLIVWEIQWDVRPTIDELAAERERQLKAHATRCAGRPRR